MPSVLITTVGAANANSYASYAEYQAYWGARLFNTAPLAASQAVAESGMLWAERLLDSIFRWRGLAVDGVQALAWPRTGLLTPNGFPINATTIPVQLKNAQCEYAGILLSGDRTADDPNLKVLGSTTGITEIKAGPVLLKFDKNTFSSLEDFDAYVRSLGSDFKYLSAAMPDSVRSLIPGGWIVEAQLKRKILFGAL